MSTTPPWRKQRPAKPRRKLTDAQKARARAAAKQAGRPYPNLVDNMNAMRPAKPAKKKAAKKRAPAKKRAAKKRAPAKRA